MSGDLARQQNRLLIPRWRLFTKTLRTGELASPKRPEDRQPRSSDFLRKLENWSIQPSLFSAAELVETAIIEGYEEEAINAARRLVQSEKTATISLRLQAYDLLKRHGVNIESPQQVLHDHKAASIGIRDPIRANINDALAWLDLAYFQTNSGHVEQAQRSMAVALGLAPENRFVIRSASRFLLHRGRPDHARDLLLRSAAINNDPWLMSAEISISELLEKGPRTAKTGARLIEDGLVNYRNTTELASALATLEIGGNRKKMRQLFKHSLLSPTGNSLAQASWASPLVNIDLVPTGMRINGEYEAPAHQSYNEGKFVEALEYGRKWVGDETFATRPFEFTAGTACVVEQFDVALKYAEEGLKRSPNSDRLLLAKAFTLANTGRTEQASLVLQNIDRKSEKGVFGFFANANEGLVAFREGRNEDAKVLYRQAIRGFRQLGDATYVASALSYQAREAFRAGDADADKLLQEAKESVEKVPKSKTALHAFNLALADRREKTADQTKVPEKLIWSSPNFSGVIEADSEQNEGTTKKLKNS